MAIFPNIETDLILQVDDKIRLDSSKTYVGKDESTEVTLVEIEPEAAAGFINVTGSSFKDWYLDWEYATDGDKVVSCRVTTDGSPVTVTKTITVLSVADDNLFSGDEDLITLESDILKYVPDGRKTFIYMHREAQRQIIEYLNKIGLRRVGGDRLQNEDMLDVDQVRFWSRYVTYRIIYDDLSTSPGDLFEVKSNKFLQEEEYWKTQAEIHMDFNGDGETTTQDSVDISWRRLRRV